jgi:hypothetical protein
MNETTVKLKVLLLGLTDQEIRDKGTEFFYDGSRLYPDEVADLMLPSVVCIAQDLASRLGLNHFGYNFSLRNAGDSKLPLEMESSDTTAMFFEIAPFVVEVFDSDVLSCHKDLARLFERASRVVQPDFSLDSDSNYGELTA